MQLESLLSKGQKLPVIPEVVRDLLKSFNDDHADSGSIAKKIGVDQALTAKVIRLANSARYGLPRQVASISDAMLILDFSTLRSLVVASGLTTAFQAPTSLDLKEFWRASLATAGYAAWLARLGGHREDIGFTGGMMLHTGMLLLHMEAPEKAKAIDLAVVAGGVRSDLERAEFGFTHVDVSSELAVHWNFPEEIVAGMQDYADPGTTATFDPYGAIYRLADFIAESLLRGEEPTSWPVSLPLDLAVELGLDIDNLLSSLPPLNAILEGLEELL